MLTDRRALIVEPGPREAPRVSAFPPEKLAGIRLVERTGGSGDLVFEEERDWNWNRRREAGFLGLDDVRLAERLINKHLGASVRRREAVGVSARGLLSLGLSSPVRTVRVMRMSGWRPS